MIGKAIAREIGDFIRYDAKVTRIQQNDSGVTVSYVNAKENSNAPATPQLAKADWCVCTIPLSILSQIQIDVGPRMKAAIDAVPYSSSVKIGLQFKRRFWEEDEAIYGGISYNRSADPADLLSQQRYNRTGRGVLLGAMSMGAPMRTNSTRWRRRIGSRARSNSASRFIPIPRRVRERDRGGLAPGTLHAGLRRSWTEEMREQHYDNLCQIDAGSFSPASTPPTFRHGRRVRFFSSLDAITRLHERVVRM